MSGRLSPLEPYLPPVLLRGLRALARRWSAPGAVASGEAQATFQPEDIDTIRDLFHRHGSDANGPWEALRHAHMPLPAWFKRGLDPWSPAYRAQQERLWQLIAGVERRYDPNADEVEVYGGDIDAIRQPAYYMRRDRLAIASASDHILATGMMLKHSGLQAGDHALEYGAGFAQTALAFARLGVNVHTVDISRSFCQWVQEQADFYRVPLHPRQGHFGHNPRPGQRYRLIWFYESFHHCWDFERVVPLLAPMLEDGGRIILAGEPVFEREYAAVPYPWGVRLHSEVAAVMRHTRWMELGFTEAFLFELFARSGFKGHRVACEPSLFGQLFIFERPPRARPEAAEMRWDVASGKLHSLNGLLKDGAYRTKGEAGFLAFCPCDPVPAGEWWAEIQLDPRGAPSGRVQVDVVSQEGKLSHAQRWFVLPNSDGPTLWLSFTLAEPTADLYVRVLAEASTEAGVRSIGLARQPD